MGQDVYDYTTQGPYKDIQKKSITVLGLRNEDKVYSVRGAIKYPVTEGDNVSLPLIVFLNGFLIDLSYYTYIADRLVSWGFVVVQYDVSKVFINTDTDQVAIFEGVIDYIQKQLSEDDKYLDNIKPDLDNIGIMGHSRGGKVSTLIYTDGYGIKAAFPIDPVDNTRFTPESVEYPSAIKALNASTLPIGIVGFGVVGSCNPPGNNSFNFFDASPKGSFFYEIVNTGHTQILDGFALVKSVCKRGSNSDAESQQLILPPAVAWLRRNLYKDDDASFEKFLDYANDLQDKGAIKYAFKSDKQNYKFQTTRPKKIGKKREIILQT